MKYYNFGTTAGFIQEQADNRDYTNKDIMKTVRTDDNITETQWRYVVVDRSYMYDEDERKWFLGEIKETDSDNWPVGNRAYGIFGV